jgi:ParB-like nuclease domain
MRSPGQLPLTMQENHSIPSSDVNGSLGNGSQPELDHVQVRSLSSIRPAPENDDIYNPIAWDDPEIGELAKSIKTHGLQEPLLVSRDGFIISGHRRRMAAILAELELVPVRVHPISRTENPNAFIKLLVTMNSQRIKSTTELLHESTVKIDPRVAHEQIVSERKEKQNQRNIDHLSVIDPFSDGRRCEITKAKLPLLDAIRRVLNEQKGYWPLSARQVHYRLLGADAPLLHASKPGRYVNDLKSYRALTDILTRGRIAGLIPWAATDDETRPIDLNAAFNGPAEFFRDQLGRFLKGYWRNRQQSQPNHIEICIEKLTVRTILQQVAEEYTIPVSTVRGMGSTPPKKKLANRFRLSRKKKLILLVVSDLDPAGDAIADDLVKCFRRDYRISNIEAFKVALTIEQVEELGLEPSMDAKEESPTYNAFVERYGITDAYELEAMEPEALAGTLRDAIDDVLDIDLYNQELDAEEADSAEIIAVRNQADQFFKSMNLGTETED